MYALTCEGGLEIERITSEYKDKDFWVILHRQNGKTMELRNGAGIIEIVDTKKV